MLDPTPESANPNRLFEEASTWYARLQASDCGGWEQSQFAQWLAISSEHHQAWNEVQDLMAALETPAKTIRNRERFTANQRTKAKPRNLPIVAKAAAILLVCAGLTATLPSALLQNLQSDFHTATGEQRQITLADGSRLWLNTDTAIRVDLQAKARRIDLLRGEAFFEVAHNPDSPFVVQAGEAHAKVTGTQFNVRYLDRHVTVAVTQGHVETSAEPPVDPVIQLNPGKSPQYTDNKLTQLGDIDNQRELAWRQGRMVFVQATLAEVVAEINRYHPGKLMIADPSLNDRRITAVFRLNHLDAAIDALHNGFGIRVSRLTNYLVLLG